jgi:hypothetical protein
MAHGGYSKRRVKPAARRSKGLGVEKKPKPKSVSLKNQIRSIDRMLRKVLLISFPSTHIRNASNFFLFLFLFIFFLLVIRARICAAMESDLELD